MSFETSNRDERYTIEARIGSGSMATVYRAYDQRLQRVVALKILHDHLSSNLELQQRFEQEAKLAARIDHPNVVRTYDIGTNNQNQTFIVSEFIDGRSLTIALRQYMNRAQPFLNPILAALVAHEIARGIDAAHRHAVVHRDLKPDNVLVSHQGEVKLTDFGVARPFDSSMTQAGQFIGSLTYASPEQVHAGKIDARSDIFSFGVILFELLTGQLPFRSTNPTDLALKISQAQVPPLNQIRSSIPIELDSLVRKCLRADPQERPQSAEQIVRDLALFLNQHEVMVSPLVIRNGFENPSLFSSTIRRSPLRSDSPQVNENPTMIAEAPPVMDTQSEPTGAYAHRHLSADAEHKPSFERVATPEPEQKAGPERSPSSVPNVRSPSGQQNKKQDKGTGKRPLISPRETQTRNKSTASSFLLKLILLLTPIAFVAALIARKSDLLPEWTNGLRTQQPQARSTPDIDPTPNLPERPTGAENSRPTPATATVQATQKPSNQAPVQATQRPARPPQPMTTPQPRKTLQPVQTKQRPQTQPNKPVREPMATRPVLAPVNKPSTDLKTSQSSGRKASLLVQTTPGSRTVELIRGARKEFLGLSARSNTPRIFQALDPGPVVLQIPAEEVDGKKYEGYQKRIVLESGQQLNLAPINSRVLTSVLIRCPAETKITTINGRRILHRGGNMSFELAVGSALEIETTSKTGARNTENMEIREEGQTVNCASR